MLSIDPNATPKIREFFREFDELCKKYQYDANVRLNVTTSGISPVLTLDDVVPKVDTEKKS